MTLVKYLAVVFLAALAVAEVPFFIPVCGRRNPNLDKCILDATNALRDRIKTGIPEMDLEGNDPLHIDELVVSNTDMIKVFGRNITARGMGDFIVETMHLDNKAHQSKTKMRFKKISLDGVGDVNINLIFSIVGHGPVHIEAADVVTEIVGKYTMVKVNGADHMRYVSVTTSLNVTDWSAAFEPSATMDSALITAINAAVEGARDEIFQTMKPNVEKIISERTMKIANKLHEKFTYDELFPDRE